ncbi:MAG: type I-U CRISPR-associated protein Csx17 [Desulfobulbus sp.]|nr:type I-U CRISPR-associated protein Csx17 [Desulfobulbus sp.]
MNIHFHTLTGCSPTPLAHYLKALGILRLVSEQADPLARGAWRDEAFTLATKLSADELAEFFLTKYQPTPLVSPWNRGSGFLSDKDKSATFLGSMEKSPLPRLKRYQDGVRAARTGQLLGALKNNADTKKEFDTLKPRYIAECRLNWRGPHLEWLEAAVILQSDGSMSWPSLLGTGGNDGRLDFTDNFRQRFAELFNLEDANAPVSEKTRALLDHALFAVPALGTGNSAIGQYSPGVAGGANSSNGLEGKGNVNPWDFILFFEGTILFSAAASRRMNTKQAGSSSAPFVLKSQAVGHLSTSSDDKATRGEQWMPLWPQFATLREISTLLGEGRAQLGRTGTREPVEMARAVARLGVARGISAFERFGYLERNGQANFAVPLGRWQVAAQPKQELLNDLDEWLVRLHQASRGDRVAKSLVAAVKRLDNAILAVASNGSIPLRWQNILFAIAEIDLLAAKGVLDGKDPSGNKRKGQILSSLQPGWITAADDGSPEFRLALALATQYGIRRHWLPLNGYGRLDDTCSSSVVCFGRDLIADAIACIERRLVESSGNVTRSFEQNPIRQTLCADLRDIAAFLQGGLDHNRILRLSRAFMALNANALKEQEKIPVMRPKGQVVLDDAFALFRLCLAPKYWQEGNTGQGVIPVRANIFRRLASGDMANATRLAAGHLKTHGIVSPIQLATGDARLLAASLIFPLSRSSRDRLIQDFTINSTDSQGAQNHEH